MPTFTTAISNVTDFTNWCNGTVAGSVTNPVPTGNGGGNTYRGEITNVELVLTAGVTIGTGSTTNCTIVLTAAAGASFRDNASAQTNALRYNASNGAAVNSSDASNPAITVSAANGNITISGLQIRSTASHALFLGSPASGTTITNCILWGITAGASRASLALQSTGVVVNNCLLACDWIPIYLQSGSSGLNCNNCTLAGPTDVSGGRYYGIIGDGAGNTVTCTDCAIFGFGSVINTAVGTFVSCMTDTTGTTGLTGGVSYDTTASSGHAGFQNILTATADYRIQSGSALQATGSNYGGSPPAAVTTDILGTARPQGTNWDIGAYEIVTVVAGPAAILMGAQVM